MITILNTQTCLELVKKCLSHTSFQIHWCWSMSTTNDQLMIWWMNYVENLYKYCWIPNKLILIHVYLIHIHWNTCPRLFNNYFPHHNDDLSDESSQYHVWLWLWKLAVFKRPLSSISTTSTDFGNNCLSHYNSHLYTCHSFRNDFYVHNYPNHNAW